MPVTPVPVTGSKRKHPKGSSPRKVKKGAKGTPNSTTKKLGFEKTGDSDSDAEKEAPVETPRGGVPNVQGELVPEDPIWKHLEADDNPLMKHFS